MTSSIDNDNPLLFRDLELGAYFEWEICPSDVPAKSRDEFPYGVLLQKTARAQYREVYFPFRNVDDAKWELKDKVREFQYTLELYLPNK